MLKVVRERIEYEILILGKSYYNYLMMAEYIPIKVHCYII